MYVAQQTHKCIECGHVFEYGPHDHHPAPITSKGKPVCPVCWDNFLHKNLGIGYGVVMWSEDGSEFAQESRKRLAIRQKSGIIGDTV
jgi:hypothetical protein